jgi:hypothetical protein
MNLKIRSFCYSVVIALPILSGVLFSEWEEVLGFVIPIIILCVITEYFTQWSIRKRNK